MKYISLLPNQILSSSLTTIYKGKRITFSAHALEQMCERGISKEEVMEAIFSGAETPAREGRKVFKKDFVFEKRRGKKYYKFKQVAPIVVYEEKEIVVVTVFSFYF